MQWRIRLLVSTAVAYGETHFPPNFGIQINNIFCFKYNEEEGWDSSTTQATIILHRK